MPTLPVYCNHFTLGNPKDQNSHFSTVLFIQTSDYYVISEETNCNCCTAAYLFTYRCLLIPIICLALFYGQLSVTAGGLLRCESKNCIVLFLQLLCQTKLYFDIFWHTCTLNFLPKAYFIIFFTTSKAENQLKFQQHSAPAQHVRTTVKLLCWDMPDVITATNQWLPIPVLLITESWQCYKSGSANILCEMLISLSNV